MASGGVYARTLTHTHARSAQFSFEFNCRQCVRVGIIHIAHIIMCYICVYVYNERTVDRRFLMCANQQLCIKHIQIALISSGTQTHTHKFALFRTLSHTAPAGFTWFLYFLFSLFAWNVCARGAALSFHNTHGNINKYLIFICVCACVCVREREKNKEKRMMPTLTHISVKRKFSIKLCAPAKNTLIPMHLLLD